MAIDLPEGFQLDQPQNNGLPEGFQLDEHPNNVKPQMGRGEAAFITATNPLNFGDEIKASIAALTAKIMGGASTKDIDIGDLYREARTNERTKLEQAKKTYPIQSAIIGGASDLPLEAGIIGKMGLGGASIPKLATAGGALGTLGGAGASEADTMGGVTKDALTSGVVGAVAAPIVASVAPKVVDIIGKGATSIKRMFTKTTGEQVANEAIPVDVAKRGLTKLSNAPEGKPTTALDIQEPQLQTFLRSVVNPYPQAKQIAKDFVEGRNKEAYTRINEDLKSLSKTENADDYINHLSNVQKEVASPLYAEAEADRTIVPRFEFKEVKTTTSPKTITVSEGVKSFKTDAATKTKTDFINKYKLQGKSRDIERPLVSQEEKELFKQAQGNFTSSKETAEPLSKDKIRLYRGLEQKFNKDFPLDRTDAPYGYSTWTDNPELARQYAGEKGYVYYKDLPKKYLGKEVIDTEGDRVLFFDNQKPAGLNNISGKEYLVYNEHELYNPNLIKEFKTGSSAQISKEELFNIADRYKTATQDLKKYAPKSSLQTIKELGGIADNQGELASMGITNKTLPGLLRKEGAKGVGIDDVGNGLYEAGYFNQRPSVNEVLDFIDKEVRNTKIGNRATPFSENSIKYNEAKQFLDEADSLGIDIDAINKLKKITPQTSKSGVAGIKSGSSYDKRDVSKKGIEEFQNTLRKQTTRIEEGGKVVNIRKDITNLHEMSPKSIELAKQLDELENNQVFQETRNKAKQFLNPDALDNSIETLHATREMFDDKISVAIRNGQNKEVRRLSILRSKVDNIIGKVSPVFKQADEAFKPLAIKKEAVEFGKEFTKYKPTEINQKINELTSKSGLNKNEILEDARVGVKDFILKETEKAIKFEGSNIPTEIQIKEIIKNKFKRDQLKTFFPASEDYSKFINNLNQEVLYNKTIKNLNLTKDEIKQNSNNFVRNAFASLVSVYTTGFGKSRLSIDTAKVGEAILIKNYKGLNDKTAQELSRIFIDRNASIKMLKNIVDRADKTQKPVIQKAIDDIYPAILAGHIGSKTTEK